MVVLITISGVGLAGMQLLTSFLLAKSGSVLGSEGSELTVEKGKLAFKSSITGLFVLVFSFAFFYVFVYQIYVLKELDVGIAARESGTQAQQPAAAVQLPGPAPIVSPGASTPR